MNLVVNASTTSDPDIDSAYEDSLRFLYDRINYEKMASGTARYPFRLRRTQQLLGRLGLSDVLDEDLAAGSPAKTPIVHIAGTKGKGSTSTMVASILTAAGYRTGLYTSPHLHDLRERFRVDGDPCTKLQFIDLIQRIEPVAAALEADGLGSPSFFELTTAIALLHFDTQTCDAIVLEVGLGGRLDSTNVCRPAVTAVTSIGLDHQHVLGDTLAEIASEKAGIVKPGIPSVSGVRSGDAAQVIQQRCQDQAAPLFKLGEDFDLDRAIDPQWGSQVKFQGRTKPIDNEIEFHLNLEGQHQAQNAALAVAIVGLLNQQGLQISDEAVQQALKTVRCPARIERYCLPRQINVIVDAAHNDDSIQALCRCLAERIGQRRSDLTIVFGTSRDKTAEPMLRRLAPLANLLLLTQFKGNPRLTPADELLSYVPEADQGRVRVVVDPIEACQAGLEVTPAGGTLVVCGSFFLAAETRQWIADQAVSNREALPDSTSDA